MNGQMLKRPRENVEQVMEIVLVKGNKGRLWFCTSVFCQLPHRSFTSWQKCWIFVQFQFILYC